MKHPLIIIVFITTTFILFAFQASKPDRMNTASNDLTFTILYENYVFNNDLESDWGFSCMIEGLEKTILFDSGAKGNILLSNMQAVPIAVEIKQ